MNASLRTARDLVSIFTASLSAFVAVALLLLGATSLRAQTIAVTTNDVVTMRQMLTTATTWDAKGKQANGKPMPGGSAQVELIAPPQMDFFS